MSKFIRPLLAAGAVAAAFVQVDAMAAAAGPTATLTVKGVIKPLACTLNLDGSVNGSVDFGTIDKATLKSADFNVLAPKSVELKVDCGTGSAAKVGLTVTDSRASSKVANIRTAIPGSSDTGLFGLGGSTGANGAIDKRVGAYRLTLDNFRGDTTPVTSITTDSTAPASGNFVWSTNTTKELRTDRTSAFGVASEGGTLSAGSYKVLVGNLIVTPIINKKDDLPATEEVLLDGQATLQMHYL